MTNSHNKLIGSNHQSCEGRQNIHSAERIFNNTSLSYTHKEGGRKRSHKSPSTQFFTTNSSTNILVTPTKGRNEQNSRPVINVIRNRTSSILLSQSSACGSPPNFSHYAGSKCYDAPAPTALPKPPCHWTSCTTEKSQKSKRFDLISHNLKSILNVQA